MPGMLGNGCALARQRLVSAVESLREASPREKFVSARRAAFLGGIRTPMRMFGGNLVNVSLRTLAVHPAEVAVDYVRSVAKSAREGRISMTPDEFRTIKIGLDQTGLKRVAAAWSQGWNPTRGALREAKAAYQATPGPWNAVKQAVTTFADELNTRLDAEHIYRQEDYQGNTHYNNPTTNAMVNGIFGIAEALDRPYWHVVHDFSIHLQSKVMAAAEGYKGPELKAREAYWFEHPTDEMALRAVDQANYALFKNKTPLGLAAQDLKQGLARRADRKIKPEVTGYDRVKQESAKFAHGIGSLAAEIPLTFTGVPSAVAGQSVSLAAGPLSLVRLIGKANRSPVRAAKIIAESGIGTALIATGYQMASQGLLVGAVPSSASERAQFYAEGKQPYSVKVGNAWVDLRWAMPVAAPLYAGAGLFWSKDVGGGLEQGVKMLTQQTYLENLDQTIQALQSPQRKGARFVASQVPLPALVGQVARATDATERQPGNLAEMLAVKIPGLSHLVPPKVDATGRIRQRTPIERLSEVASPATVSQSTETPITKEFRRVGIPLTEPSESNTVKGQKVQRTAREQVEYEQQVGAAMTDYLKTVMASPEYQQLPDEYKAIVLKKVRDVFHEKYGRQDAAKRLMR